MKPVVLILLVFNLVQAGFAQNTKKAVEERRFTSNPLAGARLLITPALGWSDLHIHEINHQIESIHRIRIADFQRF